MGSGGVGNDPPEAVSNELMRVMVSVHVTVLSSKNGSVIVSVVGLVSPPCVSVATEYEVLVVYDENSRVESIKPDARDTEDGAGSNELMRVTVSVQGLVPTLKISSVTVSIVGLVSPVTVDVATKLEVLVVYDENVRVSSTRPDARDAEAMDDTVMDWENEDVVGLNVEKLVAENGVEPVVGGTIVVVDQDGRGAEDCVGGSDTSVRGTEEELTMKPVVGTELEDSSVA